MTFLAALHRLLVPAASAVSLDNAGSQNPGIAAMWQKICATMPFCDVGVDAPRLFACKIARVVFGSLSGIAVCIVIYAGIQLITGQGDEGKIGEAKKTILFAALGTFLGVMAWALVPFAAMAISYAFGSATFAVVPLQCQ